MIRTAITRGSSSSSFRRSFHNALSNNSNAFSCAIGTTTIHGINFDSNNNHCPQNQYQRITTRNFAFGINWIKGKIQGNNNNNNNNNDDTIATTTDSSSSTATPTSLDNGVTTITDATTTTATTTTTTTEPSFDDTMSKLFPNDTSVASQGTTDALSASGDTVYNVATGENVILSHFEPTWYNLADQAVNVINFVHDTSGLPYGLSIVGTTLVVRTLLLPLFIKTQQNTSRMQHMQPEMKLLKDKMEALGPNPDKQQQLKLGLQMKALFDKYDCNPFRAMVLPLVQAPIFMSMFFGLRKMPNYIEYYEPFKNGGMLWFNDLTVSDPYYILPISSAISFIIMIELGKDNMTASDPKQGAMMLNVFRGLAFMMIPVATTFSTSILCYWVTNNTVSLIQTAAFQNKAIRKQLGIWDPPKPVPGIEKAKSITETLTETMNKATGKHITDAQRMKQHNDAIDSKRKAQALREQATGMGGGEDDNRRKGRRRRGGR